MGASLSFGGVNMRKKKSAMPEEILVYVCEYDQEKPIFAVALNVTEIPEGSDGDTIGVYTLSRETTLSVKRELK
jgi:hypothetical protein